MMMTEKDKMVWGFTKKIHVPQACTSTDGRQRAKNSPLASSDGTQIAQQSRMERNWRLEMNESKQGANDK